MLVPAARPLLSVTVEQIEYIMSLKGAQTSEQKSHLEQLKRDAKRVEAARPGDEGPAFMNAPLSWWADLNVYNPVANAAALSLPILILQGGRDYHVTTADFDPFFKGLATRSNVSMRLFPALNHLFMTGAGVAGSGDYNSAGHVDVEAIQAIAEFARKL